jgi:hypothetical protein
MSYEAEFDNTFIMEKKDKIDESHPNSKKDKNL